MELDGVTVTFYGSVGLPPLLEEVAELVARLMGDCLGDGWTWEDMARQDTARYVVTELCIAGYVITKAAVE